MKLSYRVISQLKGALDFVMAGRPRVIRRNNEDHIVNEPFKLDADTLLAVAVNLNKIDEVVRPYLAARKKLVTDALAEFNADKTSPVGELPSNSPQGQAVLMQLDRQDDTEVEIDLKKLKLGLFKIDDNPGIAPALAGLLHIEDSLN